MSWKSASDLHVPHRPLPSTTGPPPARDDLLGGVVTLQVGPSRKEFVVHEKLLKKYSGFFAGALNGHFKEPKTRVVHLQDQDPDVVHSLIHWLYTGLLSTEEADTIDNPTNPQDPECDSSC